MTTLAGSALRRYHEATKHSPLSAGQLQTPAVRPPFPSGSTGYDARDVTVS